MDKSHNFHFIKKKPLFIFLLPVFFVLHGFTRNYHSVPAGNATLLTGLYIGVSLLIAGICWLFYRDIMKAFLAAFFIMAFNFFFGTVQDSLKNLFPQTIISQYRFLLPLSFLFFLALIIRLKGKKTFYRSVLYLNILLFLFILYDAGSLLVTTSKSLKNLSAGSIENFTVCDTCRRPDVYLILLDQYAGSEALKDVFNFNNNAFENELSHRGFFFAKKSRSNYNLTPFSMASILNMDYLGPEMGRKKHLNISYTYTMIKNSLVLKFLTASGYQFYNYSVFDFPGKPANKYFSFFPYGTELITSQTFVYRIRKDIRADILSGKLPFPSLQKKIAYENLHFNENIFELTKKTSEQKTGSPKFVYAHFIMPHWPYYYDSKGNPLPIEKLSGFRKTNAHDYIEYLQYCNKKILELTDNILAKSASPPIILLLSDHGFRHPERNTDRKYDFMNLNAIYLPEKNYTLFSDTITNVNVFRTIFNSCFNQHFALLPDSTIDLWD